MTVAKAFDLAIQHQQAGRLAEAEHLCRQILAVAPQHADALHLLGVIAHQVGRSQIAVELIRGAIALNPNNPEFHSNLGTALSDQGRLAEAIAAYRHAVRLKPDFDAAHYNLGNSLRIHGQFDEAIVSYRRAIQLKPDFAEAYSNLGDALTCKAQFDEAVAAYRCALQFKPDGDRSQNNLGNAFKDRGQLDEALESYRRAISLNPAVTAFHSNLVYAAHFHPGYDAAALREENARWQRQHGVPLERFIRPHGNDADPVRRLKVGYVSPDFWHHVVCHFLTPLLEAHDHAGFEIYCYASVKRPDAITERMKKTADVWRDVLGVPDEALAEMIRADGIDLLVDLSQHMADNRLPVFARKPAPVQVAWLGYPGSTGLRAMDYRLTDAYMEPEGSAWSESVEVPLRLPDSWFCFDLIDEYPLPGELPALRTGNVTFGGLNNFCKVSGAVLQRWAEVLHAVEGSRLLLQCPEGETQARVRQSFAALGIGADRLELVARTATRLEFLKRFERIDIALDPFPYNGGTTTCEALLMGIPVLTLPGSTALSRIGLSILSACGMPEFVAGSEADYLRLAASLARDLPRLSHLRATLRERMKSSPFMDARRFARDVEEAYRAMWRMWCERQAAVASP